MVKTAGNSRHPQDGRIDDPKYSAPDVARSLYTSSQALQLVNMASDLHARRLDRTYQGYTLREALLQTANNPDRTILILSRRSDQTPLAAVSYSHGSGTLRGITTIHHLATLSKNVAGLALYQTMKTTIAAGSTHLRVMGVGSGLSEGFFANAGFRKAKGKARMIDVASMQKFVAWYEVKVRRK